MITNLPCAAENNTALAGSYASIAKPFGAEDRFLVAAVHTRFGAVAWFAYDCAEPDAAGLPEVIFQGQDAALALAFCKALELNPPRAARNKAVRRRMHRNAIIVAMATARTAAGK